MGILVYVDHHYRIQPPNQSVFHSHRKLLKQYLGRPSVHNQDHHNLSSFGCHRLYNVHVMFSAENCCTNSLFVPSSNASLICMEELGNGINFFHEFLIAAGVTISQADATVSTTLIMSIPFKNSCIVKVDCVTRSLRIDFL